MKDQGMTVTIYNNNDNKWNSFEARLNCHRRDITAYTDIQLYGVGGSKEEAIDELQRAIVKLTESFEKVDFSETLSVAWDNTPLDEYYAKEREHRQEEEDEEEKEEPAEETLDPQQLTAYRDELS